jgi:DNA-binding NarL/FixJ family response regulator
MGATSLEMARIFVVDDHPLVRDGLAGIINRQPDMVCCGEAASIAEAQKGITECKPDVAIIDLRLKAGDGLEFIKSLRSQYPALRMLVLSQSDESLYAERALRAGALGYVMKEQAAEEVLRAIRTVLAGGVYVSHALLTLLLRRAIDHSSGSPAGELEHLTDRELHVLQLVGAGMKTQEIAMHLNLSGKTVETYRERLKHKLGVANAVALTQYASEWLRKQNFPSGFPRRSSTANDGPAIAPHNPGAASLGRTPKPGIRCRPRLPC